MEYKLIVYMLAMLEHIATLLLKRASALVEELSKNSGGNTKPVITCKYIKIARNYHEVFTPPLPGRPLIFRKGLLYFPVWSRLFLSREEFDYFPGLYYKCFCDASTNRILD